jgi:single-stranded DNA-binding protein
MLRTFNRLCLFGYLDDDPRSRRLSDGTLTTIFTVLTTERRQGCRHVLCFRVRSYGALAETCRDRLQRDSYVWLSGTLTVRPYLEPGDTIHHGLEVRLQSLRVVEPCEIMEPPGAEAILAPDLDSVPF